MSKGSENVREALSITHPPTLLGRENWMLLTREEAARAIGVKRSTFYEMIKQDIIPDGVMIFDRTKMWRFDIIREVAERLYKGEFSGIKLWRTAKARNMKTLK